VGLIADLCEESFKLLLVEVYAFGGFPDEFLEVGEHFGMG
jgi:hypothetical protein